MSERDEVIARARQFAAEGMTDTCRIDRSEAGDPDSGATTSTWRTLVNNCPCRLQQRGTAAGQPLDAGNEGVLVQRVEVQLPLSVLGLRVGDRITWLTSRDPDLVNKVFIIHDPARKTDASARRVGVHERTQ